MTTHAAPVAGAIRPAGVGARIALAMLGFTSVASLLGWVYGVAAFHVLFLSVTIPGLVALTAVGVVTTRRPPGDVRLILSLGTIAGLIGTIGYDVFRIPFIFGGGLLLLSPIESYGVLASGVDESSGFTDFLGWSYHLTNGIGFGITYMALALRRRWGWGVLYAMALETGTVLTPFADAYALSGKWLIISIAYAAHVPYGLALGWIGQNADRWREHLDEIGPRTVPMVTALSFLGLAVWLEPWTSDARTRAGSELADGPSTLVADASLYPEFSVVPVGGCIIVRNDDELAYVIQEADGNPVISPGATQPICFSDPGVHRIKPTDEPFEGGFVIVDEERTP